MAGLFDTIGSDPVAAQRIKEQAAALEKQSELLRSLRGGFDTAGQAGLAIGGAFGGAFGRGLAGALPDQPDSPEMAQAKRQAESIKALSEFDLNTSEGLSSAAKALRERGDDLTALKLVMKAGEVRKAEAALAAKAQQQADEERRAEFKQFPSAVQEEIIARSPETLVTAIGLTPEKAQEISAKVEERNALSRAKLEKTLADVRKATATKVSGADVEQTSTVVDALTDNQFEGTPELEAASRLVAARAQALANAAADRGETTDPTKLRAQAWQELNDEGVIKHDPGKPFAGMTFGESLEIDPEKLKAPTKRAGVLKL